MAENPSSAHLKIVCLMLLEKIEKIQENSSLEYLENVCQQLQLYKKVLETTEEYLLTSNFSLAVLPFNMIMIQNSKKDANLSQPKKKRSLVSKCSDLAIESLEIAISRCGPEIAVGDPQSLTKIILNLSISMSQIDSAPPKKQSGPQKEWVLSENSHLVAARCLCTVLAKGLVRRGSTRTYKDADIDFIIEEEALPAWKSIGDHLAKIKLLAMTVESLISAAKRGVSISEGPRELATVALEGLMALGTLVSSSEVWLAFFPGLFSGLYRIARSRGQGPASLALQALAKFIVKVCADDSQDESSQSLESHVAQLLRKHGATAASDGSGGKGRVAPTCSPQIKAGPDQQIQARLDEVTKRLQMMLPRLITRCAQSSSWRVRRASVGLASGLVLRCSHRFEAFLPQLLEVPIGCILDEMAEVSDQATLALKRFREHHGAIRWAKVMDQLTGRVWEVFASLPSLARGTDPQKLQAAFDLASGYLQVLGPNGSSQLDSNIERLSVILQQVFEFDDVMIQQVHETSDFDIPDDFHSGLPTDRRDLSGYSYYRKPLRHIRQVNVHKSAKRFLGLLGATMDICMFYDSLVSKLNKEFPGICCSRNRQLMWLNSAVPLLYVADQMLVGHGTSEKNTLYESKVSQLAASTIPAFLDSKAWLLPTTIADVNDNPLVQNQDPRKRYHQELVVQRETYTRFGSKESPPSEDMPKVSAQILHGYAQIVSLLLETFGHFSEALGPGFEVHIMQVLYPVLERAADQHPTVQHTALQTLVRIACSTGHKSLKSLLHHNLDYLTDALCARLRFASLASSLLPPRLPGAIEALFQHSGAAASTPLLEDVVREVLVQVDLNWQNHSHSYALMRVLNVLVEQSNLITVATNAEEGNKGTQQPVPQESMDSEEEYWLQKLYGLVHNTGADGIEPTNFDAPHPSSSLSTEEVEEYFTNLAQKSKKEAESSLLEAKEKEDKDEREIRNPPKEVKIVSEVLERCSFFIATKDLKLQTLVLSVLGTGLRQLRFKRRLLRPRVHKLWKPVVARLDEFTQLSLRKRMQGRRRDQHALSDSTLVRSRLILDSKKKLPPKALLVGVFELIGDIANLVGDFLSLKFTEDVWPHMKILFKQWADEQRKSSTLCRDDFIVVRSGDPKHKAEFTSQTNKAQMAALRLLLRLCRNPECQRFMRPRVKEICQVCLHYLNKETEVNLRKAAIDLYCAMAEINGDVMWLTMVQLSGAQVAPPLPGLEQMKFKANPNFVHSVSVIIDHLKRFKPRMQKDFHY